MHNENYVVIPDAGIFFFSCPANERRNQVRRARSYTDYLYLSLPTTSHWPVLPAQNTFSCWDERPVQQGWQMRWQHFQRPAAKMPLDCWKSRLCFNVWAQTTPCCVCRRLLVGQQVPPCAWEWIPGQLAVTVQEGTEEAGFVPTGL